MDKPQAAKAYEKMLSQSNMKRNPMIMKGATVAEIGNASPKKPKGKLKAS